MAAPIFQIGEVVAHDAGGRSYFGTIRKIIISEDATRYLVSFGPDEEYRACTDAQLFPATVTRDA